MIEIGGKTEAIDARTNPKDKFHHYKSPTKIAFSKLIVRNLHL